MRFEQNSETIILLKEYLQYWWKIRYVVLNVVSQFRVTCFSEFIIYWNNSNSNIENNMNNDFDTSKLCFESFAILIPDILVNKSEIHSKFWYI